jgi:hypothetical protein
MRTCPTCAARYEAPAQYCQVDGASLVVDGPSTDPYLGKKILDQFRLERVVGSGGMGVVYEGLDEGLGRRVAVKILHRDLVTNKDIVQRFHREAQIAHQLDHPGIVRVVLFGQLADGNLYLVLEFLEGPTLMQALEADRVFAPARAVKVMCDVADAVGYTHARGIVHRDLKPENIILTRRGDDPEFAKILDFGIAKTLIGSGSFVTQTGLIFGTARYISPEGASGEPVDQRGDVYSLGVIAYQLLTGHTPFESDEPMQLLLKHIHEPAPSMRTYRRELAVPLALEAVVMRSLAKNPDARFDDGNAFARALREAAGAGGLEVRSLVATTSMGAIAPSAVAITAQGRSPALRRETLDEARAPAPESARAAPVPVSAVESSGVARVRTVSRGSLPTYNHGARADGAAVARATLPSPNLPARMELPVVAAPADETPLAEDVSVAAVATAIRTRPTPEEFVDPDEFPVIPRRGGAGRTFAVVVTSVVLTVLVALGAAWGLRMFPQQRRDDEIAGLLRRANDALHLGRYAHAPDNNDVEDLTDAVIALDPRNQRAFAQRHAAAVRLKVSSDAERQAGHPERAVALLQDALRLEEDATLRDELAAAQRELEAQRNAAAPAPAPRATPRPAPRAAPRPAPRDPTLDHPPEPVVPLNPAVAPAAPPEAPRAHTPRPRRDGGQVVQTPPDDDMRIVIPGTNIPLPIFGSQPQSPPPTQQPPDDPGGRTAVF